MRGWLQRTHAWLFGQDIFASVASDDALLRIHSTAEEFEGAAEELFVWPQVPLTCPLHMLHVIHGALAGITISADTSYSQSATSEMAFG